MTLRIPPRTLIAMAEARLAGRSLRSIGAQYHVERQSVRNYLAPLVPSAGWYCAWPPSRKRKPPELTGRLR